uniref:Putative secreted protein n=1 Tax=Anopheles darlingi TaxID=43151 RepID=A0A2M4DFB6_ANODA
MLARCFSNFSSFSRISVSLLCFSSCCFSFCKFCSCFSTFGSDRIWAMLPPGIWLRSGRPSPPNPPTPIPTPGPTPPPPIAGPPADIGITEGEFLSSSSSLP